MSVQEERSFEGILKRLLEEARGQFPELDTREGSLIYSALAPAAVELERLYVALQVSLEMSYADTASREYLIRRAMERGIRPLEASSAVIEAAMEPEDVPLGLGTRFRAGTVIYAVSGWSGDDSPLLTAESAGAIGNQSGGRLTPVDLVEGLRSASIRALAVPGRDVEETEAFRRRYLESRRAESFGGNIAAYREKVLAVAGVGGVQVTPTPEGPGTVGIRILGADFSPPSATLIAAVQEILDPPESSGAGSGWAPIGHRVTVNGALAVSVFVSADLTLESGADMAAVRGAALAVIEAYFLELREAWDQGERMVVRVSQVDTRLLDVRGVLDVADTTLNGQRGNLLLQEAEVPELSGLVLWSE
ncbi:MAG: baseplate J/gp47 family protein [Oscillospiraceae bacterium]|nr:baseplate J/gp47 family protein [Oscillospiraceae bacterium]